MNSTVACTMAAYEFLALRCLLMRDILYLNLVTVSGVYSRSRGKCQVLPTHPPFGHTSPAAPGAHRLARLLHKLLIPVVGARALPAKMLSAHVHAPLPAKKLVL